MKADDALLPQPPGGTAPGAALSLAVHVGLIAALALSVNWRVRQTEVAAAELWASVPQVAAPRAVEPPPPPAPAPAPTPAPPPPPPAPSPAQQREAEIATERAEKKARQEKEEREAAERLKKQRAAEEERQRELAEKKAAEQKQREAAEARKAEAARAEKLRDEQMKRMLGSLGGTGAPNSQGTAERDAAPSQDYVNRLIAILRSNVVYADDGKGNPAVDIEVRATPGGTIISSRVVKKSGVPEWDEAALRAVEKTGTLPRQADGRVPTSLIITFRPKA